MDSKRYKFLRYPSGKAKAVTLSYDDGCPEDMYFSDIITKYGLKCTFNLNSKSLRGETVSDEQFKEYILKRGHEIAVHGANHRAEGTLSSIEGIRDVLDCRLELEEICERISGKDDIWYATNMEIYEYVDAYNSLVYSADGSMLYNPTLMKIWFDIDGRLYEINPGETINI